MLLQLRREAKLSKKNYIVLVVVVIHPSVMRTCLVYPAALTLPIILSYQQPEKLWNFTLN